MNATQREHYGPILRAVLDAGGLSRAEISRHTGLRPNTVGETVTRMIKAGWLRTTGTLTPARQLEREGMGRPARGLEADPARVRVAGLAIRPRVVEGVRLNLRGEPAGYRVRNTIVSGGLAHATRSLAEQLMGPEVLALGVSCTGMVDETQMRLLFTSASPASRGLSLEPLLEAAASRPVALDNDVQALGDRWRLTHPEADAKSVLLVHLEDGAVGAALLPAGRPADAGVVRGANELGHLQVAVSVDAPRCYCGQTHCTERVFSSAMVRRLGGSTQRLPAVLRHWAEAVNSAEDDAVTAGQIITDALAASLADAINLLRPHHVVLAGLSRHPNLLSALAPPLNARVKRRLLPVLRERVQFGCFSLLEKDHAAVTAGHLALSILTGRRAPSGGGTIVRHALANTGRAAVG